MKTETIKVQISCCNAMFPSALMFQGTLSDTVSRFDAHKNLNYETTYRTCLPKNKY